ncbi:MAG: hypothetical protein GX323_02745 [Clostridiales bacterium]|nr:hypothetical protein [Clostridiales bacterium]
MNKLKRILAMLVAITLVLLYIVTFIFALIDSVHADALFKASLFSTFAVPIFIYAIMLVYKLSKDRSKEEDRE